MTQGSPEELQELRITATNTFTCNEELCPPEPTPDPTGDPTNSPTDTPTGDPTGDPTDGPTDEDTEGPPTGPEKPDPTQSEPTGPSSEAAPETSTAQPPSTAPGETFTSEGPASGVDPSSAPAASGQASKGASPADGKQLPTTGAEVLGLVAAGAGLLLLGSVLILVRRRKQLS